MSRKDLDDVESSNVSKVSEHEEDEVDTGEINRPLTIVLHG